MSEETLEAIKADYGEGYEWERLKERLLKFMPHLSQEDVGDVAAIVLGTCKECWSDDPSCQCWNDE